VPEEQRRALLHAPPTAPGPTRSSRISGPCATSCSTTPTTRTTPFWPTGSTPTWLGAMPTRGTPRSWPPSAGAGPRCGPNKASAGAARRPARPEQGPRPSFWRQQGLIDSPDNTLKTVWCTKAPAKFSDRAGRAPDPAYMAQRERTFAQTFPVGALGARIGVTIQCAAASGGARRGRAANNSGTGYEVPASGPYEGFFEASPGPKSVLNSPTGSSLTSTA